MSNENPFEKLSQARLEEEARRSKRLQIAQPFNGMVTETLQQLVQAVGMTARVYPMDDWGRWRLVQPSVTSRRFSSAFELTIDVDVQENNHQTSFHLFARKTYYDGSGLADNFNIPATKDDLVKILSETYARYAE